MGWVGMLAWEGGWDAAISNANPSPGCVASFDLLLQFSRHRSREHVGEAGHSLGRLQWFLNLFWIQCSSTGLPVLVQIRIVPLIVLLQTPSTVM